MDPSWRVQWIHYGTSTHPKIHRELSTIINYVQQLKKHWYPCFYRIKHDEQSMLELFLTPLELPNNWRLNRPERGHGKPWFSIALDHFLMILHTHNGPFWQAFPSNSEYFSMPPSQTSFLNICCWIYAKSEDLRTPSGIRRAVKCLQNDSTTANNLHKIL